MYAPNDDSPDFFHNILDTINEFDNSRVLIVGDYNLVINPQMDYHNYLHVNNPRARNKVLELMETCQLTDVYTKKCRELHPDDRIYTWRKAYPIKQARLDFFLISEPIVLDVNQADILSSYRSDHSPVSLSIRLNEFQHGKGQWKFNNSLLEDVIYLDQIKFVIVDTKSQYAVLTYLDNIPDSEIQFTTNDQLFLEALLMEMRAKTISYSILKTRQNKDNEKDLLNDIRKLETRYSENVDLINTERAELESIREQKLKGSLIRPRVKWVEQGEKPTKYFCNLENRNFTSKIIPRVINERNEEITEQNEILREVEKYYKTLFSQNDYELYQCNLTDEMILGLNYDILDETDKISLEGKISYEESVENVT